MQSFKNNISNLIAIFAPQFIENKNSFSESEWSELYKISENTFVEETEESKQKAAGAGLTDNDWIWFWRFKSKRFRWI